ncbi:glycoside hydrolase [Streptomyces sp. A7024]|uniref:Glycoside hydrolase n=1 Tax=Streptomyces coryli TaxID=1128680 RepID=A0A6G4TWE7_9ACTN|nr:C40 family peptidase [Streptomyces coryli]NGN64102.1 glycoside hydrolase [Streptomyces coryli]
MRGGSVAVSTALVIGLVGGWAVPSASAEPRPEPTPTQTLSIEEVHAKVTELYEKAEAATEAYNAAEEQAKKQSAAVVKLARAAASAQAKLERLQKKAGAAARAQYRGGGLPAEAQLLLSRNPENFVDDLQLARKGQAGAGRLLNQLVTTKSQLEGYTADAADRWERFESKRKAKEKAKKEIKSQLAAAKKLEQRLAAEERARLKELDEQKARDAQAKWLDSGILDEINGKASKAGKQAVKYATEQLGKDYVWGAEGPDTFDCSGLTLRAWQSAGHTIPRTSQEQDRQLQHINIKEMRPGDLIIYKGDASHVGIYVGKGAMIHAPRPGRQVTVAGAGSLPIKSVVRPDA